MYMSPSACHVDHEISLLPRSIIFVASNLWRKSIHLVLLDKSTFVLDVVQVVGNHVLWDVSADCGRLLPAHLKRTNLPQDSPADFSCYLPHSPLLSPSTSSQSTQQPSAPHPPQRRCRLDCLLWSSGQWLNLPQGDNVSSDLFMLCPPSRQADHVHRTKENPFQSAGTASCTMAPSA